jgi:Glycosyltransferase
MKVAFVGDIINYGHFLSTTGTSFIYLLSEIDEVEKIDAFVPLKNKTIEPAYYPNKLKIIETYKYNDPLILFKISSKVKNLYDLVLFNLLLTGFGSSSLSNFFGLISPLILNKLKKQNIKAIYHNSLFINNYKLLGYNSIMDDIKVPVAKNTERKIFYSIPTFFLLKEYVRIIKENMPNSKINYLNGTYLEAIPTIFINKLINEEKIIAFKEDQTKPNIILNGFWGPQKDIKNLLEILSNLKKKGYEFNLIISGDINRHFKDYELLFRNLLIKYGFEKNYIGYINEKDILELFLKADLLILPYNTSGGHSGVLERAKFFEVPSIVTNFPEYQEQAEGYNFIKLVNNSEMQDAIIQFLDRWINKNRIIKVKSKIEYVKNNVKILLKE